MKFSMYFVLVGMRKEKEEEREKNCKMMLIQESELMLGVVLPKVE